jgi:hypothetical protein
MTVTTPSVLPLVFDSPFIPTTIVDCQLFFWCLTHPLTSNLPSFSDYFGFKTLQRGYLLKLSGKVVERPQHMLMRVAIGN